MRQRGGDGVRRVVRADDVGQVQKQLDHVLHLMLVRVSVSDDGLLDLHGGVFVQVPRKLRAGAEGDASGGAHVQRRGHVFREKKFQKPSNSLVFNVKELYNIDIVGAERRSGKVINPYSKGGINNEQNRIS